jgi:hypothetical protein
VSGGTIDLHNVASAEILDTRRAQGEHSAASVRKPSTGGLPTLIKETIGKTGSLTLARTLC